MSDAETWRGEVDRAVFATLAESSADLLPAGVAGAELTEAIAESAEGGKRTRSTMLLACHHAHGAPHHRAAVGVAAALELFHTAALIHDDLMDDSDTRRGRDATHRSMATTHREAGWLGDPHAFGTAGAILAGDLALMASHRALRSAVDSVERETGATAARLFLEMADRVTAGQYLDMRTAAQPTEAIPDQEDDIRAVMRTKTASYTGEAPLSLGAVLAGAPQARVAELRSIGIPLGIAYQLRDDILGLSGSPEATGKPAGDDIREGKRTLVLWRAWTFGSSVQRTAIGAALGVRGASDAAVARAIDAMRDSGAIDAIEDEIAALIAGARSRLAALRLPAPHGAELDAIAVGAVSRNR